MGATGVAVLLLLVTFSAVGCGGGGGGSGQGGTGVDPIEVEVGIALDTFFASVQNGSLTAALDFVDQRLQYRRANPLRVEGYDKFKTYLTEFLGKAASISVQIPDRGISPNGDEGALIRGTFVCRYRDAAGQPQEFSEKWEMVLEKIGRWRIKSLSDWDYTVGLKFPPQP